MKVAHIIVRHKSPAVFRHMVHWATTNDEMIRTNTTVFRSLFEGGLTIAGASRHGISVSCMVDCSATQLSCLVHSQIWSVELVQHTVRVRRTRANAEKVVVKACAIIVDIVKLKNRQRSL